MASHGWSSVFTNGWRLPWQSWELKSAILQGWTPRRNLVQIRRQHPVHLDRFRHWTSTIRTWSQCLNAFYPSIYFTTEVEGPVVTYLDLTIHLNQDIFSTYTTFKIHRKPTFSNVSINGASLHPRSYKFALIHLVHNRALDIPMSS